MAPRGDEFAMRRNCLVHRAVPAFAVLLLLASASPAQQKISDAEKLLFDSVNRERTARELPLLKWDDGLALAARKHAELMAEQNLLLHRLPGEADLAARALDAGARFSHITENIGKAVYASAFHNGWMHSPGHRANILDAAADSIGISVVEGDEQLFAVEDFSRAVELLSFEEQEKRVGELLVARGLHLVQIGNDAPKSCELDRDYAGNSKPRYIAHYETPNLSQLPESLAKELRSGRYKTAAVGACAAKPSSGFSRFRIVVLLY